MYLYCKFIPGKCQCAFHSFLGLLTESGKSLYSNRMKQQAVGRGRMHFPVKQKRQLRINNCLHHTVFNTQSAVSLLLTPS